MTFARYAERTAFERPLTSGVAYAVRVTHGEREQFERQQGWAIKKMYSSSNKKQSSPGPGPGDAAVAEIREPAEEYAPVIFAQDAYKHVISFDMLSGNVRIFTSIFLFSPSSSSLIAKKKIGKRKNLLLSFPLSLDLFILRPVKKLQTLVCSMWFLAGVLTSPWFFLFSFYFRKVLIWNYCRIAVMFFCNLCCCFGLSSSKGRASLSLCILVFLLQEDRDNILRARKSGKGVLTAPFKLLNNRLGVILTYTVYKYELPAYARPHERIQAAIGYLGGIFDIQALVEKLLKQLASQESIMVNVYDTTNESPISMYGDDTGSGMCHVSVLNFGDPSRKHEMHCRFEKKPPWPWLAITSSFGTLVIALLTGHIFQATVHRIAKVEDDFHKMSELKKRAEDADVAKSQVFSLTSHFLLLAHILLS
jgi:hypothetical protein